MHIFEIVVPGSSLDYPYQTPRARGEMDSLVHSLKTQFFEAMLALNLFEQSRQKEYTSPSMEEWQRGVDRSREMERIVEEERGPSTDFFKEDIRLEADARLKREEWAAGQMPSELEHQLSYIYAKAFLYALDGFSQLLKALVETPGAPPAIAELRAKMIASFPHLREVRNSAQHHEDRVRLIGPGKKLFDLKPITNGMVPPDLPVLVLNRLNGSTFGTTMGDGHYGEVDITPKTMKVLQAILQEALYAFDWIGPKRHLPGRKI